MRRIVLQIDRLVLRGFRAEERAGVGEGLQAEFARLFGDVSGFATVSTLRNVSYMSAGKVSLAREMKPQAVGSVTARAIFKKLSQ
jgi:hypothetical protein